MALDELIKALETKVIQGEYGAFSRPFVVLDVDEYQAVIKALQSKRRSSARKVPNETVRV